jgi:hypothetical protein
MVALRMDHRLQARVDPSDVLQEAYLDANRQLADDLANPVLPFYLWLRMVTGDRRRHGRGAEELRRVQPHRAPLRRGLGEPRQPPSPRRPLRRRGAAAAEGDRVEAETGDGLERAGHRLREQGRREDAIAALKTAVACDPANVMIQKNLAATERGP